MHSADSVAFSLAQEPDAVKAALKGQNFDAVYDLNGALRHVLLPSALANAHRASS